MSEIIGLIGLALIVIAWIPGIFETINSGTPGMKKRFMILYFLGSVSMGYYAFLLNSIPFMLLNLLAAIVPIIHLFYYIKKFGSKQLLKPTKNL